MTYITLVFSDTTAAENIINSIVGPLINSLSIIGGTICTLILIYAGYQYITSSGEPIKLLNSKKLIKDCIIGFLVILVATLLTTILKHAYGSQPNITTQHLPSLATIKPQSTSLGLVGVLIDAITRVLEI